MKYSLEDGLLLIRGDHSFLLVGRAEDQFSLCIETSTEEFCQGVLPGDVIAVSAPEGGVLEPALMLMELVRTWHVPAPGAAQKPPGFAQDLPRGLGCAGDPYQLLDNPGNPPGTAPGLLE